MSEEAVVSSETGTQTDPENGPANGASAGQGVAQATAGKPARNRGHRKTRRGYVVSDKMDKTVVVEVEDRVKHPLYGKVMRRTSKVKAHDEQNAVGVGDLVLIMETRPLSATKRWRVVEIIERAK
jgi:small subunit ribosomal protein S17